MTSKTMKTILFASVIAAMILPFSAMNLAEGIIGEDTRTKTIKVVNEKIKNLEDKKSKSAQENLDTIHLPYESKVHKQWELLFSTTTLVQKKQNAALSMHSFQSQHFFSYDPSDHEV